MSDIRPPLQPAPEQPPLGHDSGDRIPADELLPDVKQLLDAPESSKYEDCKDSVEHHCHSSNRPAMLGDQDQNEVADAPKEATAHIRQTVPHAPFLADRSIRDRAVLADPGVSDPDAVAMGSIPSVADCEREIAAPQTPQTSNTPNAPNTQLAEDTDFAQPTGWGSLWRIERNGKYYRWRLRFTEGKDTPKEWRRLDRTGGKITPPIEAALNARPGTGRHRASRIAAERLRCRALAVAERLRPIPRIGTEGED